MTATYYITSQDLQLGPFTIDEIIAKLAVQELNWHDYIYDDNKKEWVLLKEYDSLLAKSNVTHLADVDPLKKRIWFILNKDSSNYGPFSKLELVQMLKEKTLQEYDFVWHQGMAEWQRISEVEDFSAQEILRYYERYSLPKSAGDQIFFRRKHPRSKMSGEAIVHDQKKIYKTVGVEISEGGAGLLIYGANFEKGQQVHLLFKSGQDVPPFSAVCKVVSKKGNIYGVQFMDISAAAKFSIADYAILKSAA